MSTEETATTTPAEVPVQGSESFGFTWRQTCAFCRKPAATRCAHCKGIFYCCEDHQTKDWEKHKPLCIDFKAAAAEAAASKTGSVALTYFKSLEGIFDIAAPFFVRGGVFDNIGVKVETIVPKRVDGRHVNVLVTSENLGHVVTPEEFFSARPELYYMTHTIGKGMLYALTFTFALDAIVESSNIKPKLSIFGEEVTSFGVAEKVNVSKNYEVLILVDGKTEQPYQTNASSGKEHGLVWVRTVSDKVYLIDFAAAQFGCKDKWNEAPLFVTLRDSKEAKGLYGCDKEGRVGMEWNWVESRELNECLKDYLRLNDYEEVEGEGAPHLGKQIQVGVRHLVAHTKAVYDLK